MFPIRDLNPTRTLPLVTLALVVANIAVFFAVQPHGDPRGEAEFLYRHAAIACEVRQGEPLTRGELLSGRCEQPGAEVFAEKRVRLSLLSSLFLHGSVLHLLGNAWFLWLFGNNVEEAFGRVAYGLFYLAGGVVAALGFVLVHPEDTQPLIGASGAIAAVLGAYLALFPGRQVLALMVYLLVPVPAALFLALWFFFQFTMNDPGVAWEAHVGGFMFGLASAMVLRPLLLARLRAVHAPPGAGAD